MTHKTDIDLSTYKEAFYSAPIGMALVTPEGAWLEVNDTLPQIIGYSKKELLKMTFQDITHPEDLEKDLGLVQQMLNKEIDTYQLIKRYIHKNGSIVWVLLSVTLMWEDEKPHYFISQIVDINERKKIEEKLEEKVEELKKLNDAMTGRELKMVELKEEIQKLKQNK